MLQFNDDFFETEDKDGFIVSELMKRTWAAQMEVLDEIDRICKKHSITWFAYYGTLLGAVRHKGFIPWDDDIDIAMKKEDYIKFLQVVGEELPEKYCVLNTYTENEYKNAFTRITNDHGINFSEQHMEKFHGCPFVVGVDIFPLYYIPRDTEQAAVLDALIQIIRAASNYVQSEKEEQLRECLVALEAATGYQFSQEKSLQTQLILLFDQVGRLYREEESDEMTIFGDYIRNGYRVRAEWLKDIIQLPFENIMVNVPKEYKNVLEGMFPDYMTPRRECDTHAYPFYKDQLVLLRDYVEKRDDSWKKSQKIQLEENWQEKIKGKKVIVYHTNADSMMRYNEFAAAKIRQVFHDAKERKDIILWWVPCLLENSEMKFAGRMVSNLVEEYKQIMDEYCRDGYGIYDVTGDIKRAVSVADYFYGDEGQLAQCFREAEKSVMIQNYEE